MMKPSLYLYCKQKVLLAPLFVPDCSNSEHATCCWSVSHPLLQEERCSLFPLHDVSIVYGGGEGEKERERESERETERDRERETDRQTDRHTERERVDYWMPQIPVE